VTRHAGGSQHAVRRWLVSILILTLAFLRPLTSLVVYAAGSELFSYILLIPFVAAYLLLIKRGTLPPVAEKALPESVSLASVALAALGTDLYWRERLSLNDHLALMSFAYVSTIVAGGFLFMGRPWMSRAAFPMAFLLFLVPLPDAIVHWIETASVLRSADAAAFFFQLTGTPMLRDGTLLALPGVTLRVAEECSGIRSSWVLFITSLVASHLFLHRPWARIILVVFVVPLAIVRNGFRILVIGLLCVHVGPHMIDSIIHRRGGPLFFALSLVPLVALLWWLRRVEVPLGSALTPWRSAASPSARKASAG
jgi:exosortase C (VPDSG-CTERM-specific)